MTNDASRFLRDDRLIIGLIAGWAVLIVHHTRSYIL
jgi:hypothetical protein